MTRYELFLTDVADAEMDAAADWFALNRSVEYAARWYEGLRDAIARIPEMPRSYSVAEESDLFGFEVRRMLYNGPSGRRGGTAYRLLFQIIDPTPGEETGVIRILHVWHGARRPERERRADSE